MGKNHGMEKRKEKKKREEKKLMTISKDNKWVVLSLLKLKDDKLFLQGMWNIPIFYKVYKKRHKNHKVQKSKIWGISRWSVGLFF